MNAYELADKLIAGGGDYMMNIGFMLRQQADRIAELEKQSWTEKDLKNACRNARLSEDDFLRIKAYLPVYTTPQTKPLSEKEVYEVFNKCYPNNGDGDVVTLVDFARAIEERHGIK